MELNYTRQEKIAGIFIVSTLLLLLATVVVIGRGKDWFKEYVDYYAEFDESYNLEQNAAVKLLNAEIGKVLKISLEGDKVRVRLGILSEYAQRIRTDSVATVESPTFIGSEYISIDPGSASAPLISEGGKISSAPKRSASDIIKEFELEKTAKMLVDAVQQFSEMMATLKDPSGPLFSALNSVNNTLAGADRIVGYIESGQGSLGGIVKSNELIDTVHEKLADVEPIIANVDKATAELPSTIRQVRATLEAVKKIEKHLDPILSNLALVSKEAPNALSLARENLLLLKRIQEPLIPPALEAKKMMGDVETAVAGLNRILTRIEAGSQEIPNMATTAKAALHDVRTALRNLDIILMSLQNNFLIRPNLPDRPRDVNVEAGLR